MASPKDYLSKSIPTCRVRGMRNLDASTKNLCPTEDELRIKRTEANSRERKRTEELNEAFKQLRDIIPSMPSDKMSKIHTLKIATDYIAYLGEIDQVRKYIYIKVLEF